MTGSIKADRQPFDPGPAAWNRILPPANGHAVLEQPVTADVVIIGAGFAGLSCARRLKQLDPKAKIVVLEARRVAEGPAGRNSGFMIDLPHNLASKDYSGLVEQDRLQTTLNREAITFAAQCADEYKMSDIAFSIPGKINAAAAKRGSEHNISYADHLGHLGEEHELLDQRAMTEICGSQYYRNGLYTPGTAMLQPALYIRSLAAGLDRDGVKIFENSPAHSFSKQSGKWEVKTDRSLVSADKVVLAVNGHVESFGYFKRRLMHIYLYGSMTRLLSASEVAALGGEANWAFTPADPFGTTVRKFTTKEGSRLVVRNRFSWSPERNVDPMKMKAIGQVHRNSFASRFPMIKDVPMEFCWGGLLCLSRNTMPAFGQLEEGLFSACCQNGLGTAMGTLSGKLLAQLILHQNTSSLETVLGMDVPEKLPPEPFLSLGANIAMRWGEFKASREL